MKELKERGVSNKTFGTAGAGAVNSARRKQVVAGIAEDKKNGKPNEERFKKDSDRLKTIGKTKKAAEAIGGKRKLKVEKHEKPHGEASKKTHKVATGVKERGRF